MEYNKLVRDNIPAIIIKNGEQPTTHIATDEEYKIALTKKLHEEIQEFLATPSFEEAADILEVMLAICDLNNVSLHMLEEIRQKKAKERGRFSQRIILDKTEKTY